jgi:hypothetical protein
VNEEDAAAFTFWLLIAAFVLASILDHFLGPGRVSYPGEEVVLLAVLARKRKQP